MHNEFTSVIERDGEWFIGFCPEIPGANGQGKSAEECRANLAAAIALIVEDRREDGLRGVPSGAVTGTAVREIVAGADGESVYSTSEVLKQNGAPGFANPLDGKLLYRR